MDPPVLVAPPLRGAWLPLVLHIGKPSRGRSRTGRQAGRDCRAEQVEEEEAQAWQVAEPTENKCLPTSLCPVIMSG